MCRSTRRYSSGIGNAAAGVGEAVWSIVISSIILIMSITRVWKSRAKFARPPIMLVQPHPRQRLDRALQLQQGEGGRHQLENDRSIFDLAAQAANCGGEDPPVVGRHRYA